MDLGRLLHPRSIVVVGGREAAEVARQCDRMGFAGPIYPINPRRAAIEGRACLGRIEDLPQAPDAAFVAIPREPTIEAVAALAALGCGGAVCYASGFAEAGPAGRRLQAALLEAAAGMPILGPNCYGLIDYLDGAALWPDQHGGRRRERGVALITQSSNLVLNLTMAARGLPIAYVMTLGNQAGVGLAEALEAFAAEPRVSAIGLHIEGFGDPVAFDRAGRAALAAGKPVVAIKAGRSAAAGRIALTHTASLAGADRAAAAFLERLGIARLGSLTALLEALKLLHCGGPLAGRRVASMSCSGGEASLVADAAEGRDLELAELTAGQRAAVKATLSDLVAVSNPLDYHTFIWGDRERLEATYAAMMDAGLDLTLLLLDFPREDRCLARDWDTALDALLGARARTGGRAALLASLPECLPESRAEALLEAGVAPLVGIDDGVAAAEAAAFIGRAQRRGPRAPLLAAPPGCGPARVLDEHRAKQALAAAGVPVPRGRLVGDLDAALAAAAAIGYPVVLKACDPGLAHKSEAGAVALDLAGPEALAAAFDGMRSLGGAFLVEEMVADAVAELLVGIDRDPVLGPVLVVGSGGLLVELAADTRVLTLPASRTEIGEALDGLRAAALIAGHRGRPPGDRDAAIAAIAALAGYACAQAGAILELDVNPLLVRPRGAMAADALIRLAGA